ncbi:hypothetical protein H1Q59_06995 [Holosporaceae bacterium 'Namur']|nr:hypothetical protein [Holosporaceae bacterium 'Namur']
MSIFKKAFVLGIVALTFCTIKYNHNNKINFTAKSVVSSTLGKNSFLCQKDY